MRDGGESCRGQAGARCGRKESAAHLYIWMHLELGCCCELSYQAGRLLPQSTPPQQHSLLAVPFMHTTPMMLLDCMEKVGGREKGGRQREGGVGMT